MSDFTHFDAQGNALMVDVSEKEKTIRQAAATGRIRMSSECFQAITQGSAQKGDVLGVARVAGIMGVKQTSSLIPLCHTLLIEKASIDFEFDEPQSSVIVFCTVKTTGVTGVEMEALTGVSIALLTIYDMCKAIDKDMEIDNIYLAEKTGGKSGAYQRMSGI
jgi:cyclic pyranopterin phosphate synthase